MCLCVYGGIFSEVGNAKWYDCKGLCRCALILCWAAKILCDEAYLEKSDQFQFNVHVLLQSGSRGMSYKQ
jgi:hypothetical protein